MDAVTNLLRSPDRTQSPRQSVQPVSETIHPTAPRPHPLERQDSFQLYMSTQLDRPTAYPSAPRVEVQPALRIKPRHIPPDLNPILILLRALHYHSKT